MKCKKHDFKPVVACKKEGFVPLLPKILRQIKEFKKEKNTE